MVESCLGNYDNNFKQAQVYYVGFCWGYKLNQAIKDI